jgi:DegV family protein with EDD domain
MSQVYILTDSTSDIPSEAASRLHITVVPAYVQIGDHSYPDGEELDRETFYAHLPKWANLPTTSVPPIDAFASAYRRLGAETDEVIAIVVSTTLSGMYNIAQRAVEDAPGLTVHVVDSEQVSLGLGWMVIAAAEAAAKGAGVQEILALVEDMKPRMRVYAALDTMEFLRRSGRVGWARAMAAQILRIKPIVEVARGKVKNLGLVRTREKAIARLEELTRAIGPLERLAILHSDAPDIEVLYRRLQGLCSPDNLITSLTTTIIGAHVGPRGLGIAAVAAR